MSEFDNTNRGVLFKNNKKETEKHPDYVGKIDVDGVEKDLAAWIRTSKAGNKFMSLSVKEAYKKPEAPQDDFKPDTEIPF